MSIRRKCTWPRCTCYFIQTICEFLPYVSQIHMQLSKELPKTMQDGHENPLHMKQGDVLLLLSSITYHSYQPITLNGRQVVVDMSTIQLSVSDWNAIFDFSIGLSIHDFDQVLSYDENLALNFTKTDYFIDHPVRPHYLDKMQAHTPSQLTFLIENILRLDCHLFLIFGHTLY